MLTMGRAKVVTKREALLDKMGVQQSVNAYLGWQRTAEITSAKRIEKAVKRLRQWPGALGTWSASGLSTTRHVYQKCS